MTKTVARLALLAALGAPLSGCAYDYVQRTDRVAYSAGDAVKANLERETTNPSHAAQYDTTGLGRSGRATGSVPIVVQ